MTKHDEDCNFEEQVDINFSGGIGEGEISGHASFGRDKHRNNKITLHMGDGWNSGVDIDFDYCPICGVKLEKEGVQK